MEPFDDPQGQAFPFWPMLLALLVGLGLVAALYPPPPEVARQEGR
jgi:hypothetical protein